jgi:conjugal transfer pilus assembly protein TraF
MKMSSIKFIALFLVLLATVLQLEAKEKTYFETHEKGWHWYREVPDTSQAEPESNKGKSERGEEKTKGPLAELKAYQKQLEEAQATAIMHPTNQNVEVYQRLQYEALERAHRFSKVWMENVYKNPELNYSLVSPTSQNARHVYLEGEEIKKLEKIKELSKEYGLFFFFKNDCAYCDAFAPTVKRFSEKHNWEVLAISEFGETNDLFERNVRDNGLAETWGVSTYPSLFAVNPKTGDVIPIANGMISIEEMEDRIMTITGGEEDDVE